MSFNYSLSSLNSFSFNCKLFLVSSNFFYKSGFYIYKVFSFLLYYLIIFTHISHLLLLDFNAYQEFSHLLIL